MNDQTLSSKERAFLEAARREVGAKAPPRELAGTAGPGAPMPQARPAAPERAAPRAPVSPLEAPTVSGWDHPAAQGAAPPTPEEEKWARIADLMESERRDAEARRRRMRRNGFAVVAVLVVVILIAFARALLR